MSILHIHKGDFDQKAARDDWNVENNMYMFYKLSYLDAETNFPSQLEILQAFYDLIVDFSNCQLNYYNYIKILALCIINSNMNHLDLAPPNTIDYKW